MDFLVYSFFYTTPCQALSSFHITGGQPLSKSEIPRKLTIRKLIDRSLLIRKLTIRRVTIRLLINRKLNSRKVTI